jgi:hypothetical protein
MLSRNETGQFQIQGNILSIDPLISLNKYTYNKGQSPAFALMIKFSDQSGNSCQLKIFDKHAEELLGIKAQQLVEWEGKRDFDPIIASFEAVNMIDRTFRIRIKKSTFDNSYEAVVV